MNFQDENSGRLGMLSMELEQLEAKNALLKKELAAAQAKIDSLMLEYCPEEMTSEQMAEWAAHQEPTTIDAAIGEKK